VTIDRDKVNLQKHYTVAPEILGLMTELLGDTTGKIILEPSAGDGALIRHIKGKPQSVDAIEIDAEAIRKHIDLPFVNSIHADFLDRVVADDLFSSPFFQTKYDGVISNPPYGLKLSKDFRASIKRRFPTVYARESYSLFLQFSIAALRPGGRYVFIVPDTFLHSVYHRPTRRFLAEYGAPTHIVQFKSKRFQTVNFGYGNMCILAGVAGPLAPTRTVVWCDVTNSNCSLQEVLAKDDAIIVEGSDLWSAVEDGWIHPSRSTGDESGSVLLGDLAECRTGIYSGDNSRFIGFDSRLGHVRGAGHPIDWDLQVRSEPLTERQRTQGVEADHAVYVPLTKGGHRDPLEPTRWAIRWDGEALKHYKTDRKARLQNADFYFKKGLAIPMVTSGRVSASLMRSSVFDQGVVGVFPHDPRYIAFLLIYLNDAIVGTRLKESVSGSANTSANYIKRLPIPRLTDVDLIEAGRIINIALDAGWEQTLAARNAYVRRFVPLTTES
jgi:predicted RNA methylase